MVFHKFDIFINKGSRTRTKVSPSVPNLPSNYEITRFDGTISSSISSSNQKNNNTSTQVVKNIQ